MLHPKVANVFDRLCQIEALKPLRATLIGGTALSYHFGHRVSYDLDICFPYHDKLPDLGFLSQLGDIEPLPFNQAVIDHAINDGADIYDYIQRFKIDGIKIDIVAGCGSNILERRIYQTDDVAMHGSLRIASPRSIFETKSLLLIDRNTTRDMYDLLYMITHQGFKASNIIETIMRYRITYRPKDIIAWIEAKRPDPARDETIHHPIMQPTTFNSLKSRLLRLLKDQ